MSEWHKWTVWTEEYTDEVSDLLHGLVKLNVGITDVEYDGAI